MISTLLQKSILRIILHLALLYMAHGCWGCKQTKHKQTSIKQDLKLQKGKPKNTNANDVPPVDTLDKNKGDKELVEEEDPYEHPDKDQSSAPELVLPSPGKCRKCNQGNNLLFDEKKIKNIRENLSMKSQFLNSKVAIINQIKQNCLKSTPYLHELEEKQAKYSSNINTLEQKQNRIGNNPMLCSKHKVKELENNFIEIQKINYKLHHVQKLIQEIKQATSYPRQQWQEQV